METKTKPTARLRIEPMGNLGLWIYIDDELTDLIMLNELKKLFGLNQKTIDGINQIYNDIILTKGEEE
ncbi:unnamed protein product [marine sediment metagenome]|uniref:Uncharacterized protein n=1 Tax=marine sediment metagenome TaxID=412755 RepID=X0ZDU0_9ZZZZ